MTTIPPIEREKTTGRYIGHWYNIESVNAHHEAIKKKLTTIIDLVRSEKIGKSNTCELIESVVLDIGQVKK